MLSASSARRESSEPTDLASTQLRSELVATLDEYGRISPSLDQVLGTLAALLIAKWAGHDDAEREAIAAFDGRPFTREIPKALSLPSWERASVDHASSVAEALKEVLAYRDAQGACARYLARVSPIATRMVEHSRPTYERLYTWVCQLDLGSVEGRTSAAHLFNDVLRIVMGRQGKLAGEFVTPEQAAALMLELADPRPEDRIYDPCFGFGELLVGAARRLHAAAWTTPPRVWSDVQRSRISGVQVNKVSYAVGLCRTLLAGIDRPDLELSDALGRPLPRNRAADGFDCILAVPPWGGQTARRSGGQFLYASRYTETLFLQHVMVNLRPGGRAVVALPDGPLFRLATDRQVRKTLLSDYSVDAVVSLPAGAFAPWTGVTVNLVAFRLVAPPSAVRFVRISPKAWGTAPEARGDDIRDGDESERRGLEVFEYGFPDDDEVETGAGSTAVSQTGGDFGSGSGSGEGSAGENGFGSATKSGTGFVDGIGSESTTAAAIEFEDGVEHGNGPMSQVELLRSVPDLVRYPQESPAGVFLYGVESWDVPIRNLALRDYELVVKRSETAALDIEIDRLVAADSSLKVEWLERIAEIRTGQSYRRRYTTRNHDATDVVAGLIRASDVKDTVDTRGAAGNPEKGVWIAEILTPSLFLIGEAQARIREKEILRPLDIVVTTWGTVGKVAFFPILVTRFEVGFASLPASFSNGPSPDIASQSMPIVITNGVAVLRAQAGVTPQYLAALLRSPAYQSWFLGRARGTTIQRLSVRALRRLRIPVPPIPVQEAVLDELSGLRGDAMAVLGRLLSGATNDPITVWLETPLVARLASGNIGGPDADKVRALFDAAEALKSLVVRTARRSDRTSYEVGDRRISAWLGMAQRIATALDGVASVPPGVGRLTVLEIALSRLREALRVLDGAEGPSVDRLRSFTRTVIELSEGEVRAMQESITLNIGLEPAEVIVGATSEVRLRVTNSSAVPLRNMFVSTRPPVGTGQLPYLADGETHRFPLTVHPRDTTQPLRILVSWRAHRLDGIAVRGEVEVPLRVLSTREAVRSGDLGASPYIVGSPVDRQEMFFGRADVMDRIKRQLGASTHANVILLEGNRRTGKTSILHQLGKPNMAPGWVPVYCSLQDAEGDDTKTGVATRNVFRLLARKTGWALHEAGVETWFPGLPDRDPGRPVQAGVPRRAESNFRRRAGIRGV